MSSSKQTDPNLYGKQNVSEQPSMTKQGKQTWKSGQPGQQSWKQGQGSMGQGSMEQGSMGQGSMGQGSMGQGSMGQGSMGSYTQQAKDIMGGKKDLGQQISRKGKQMQGGNINP